MTTVNPFDVVRNKKNGQLYSVVGCATHSETLEPTVVYVAGDGTMWTRPLQLFLEKFELVNRVMQEVEWNG